MKCKKFKNHVGCRECKLNQDEENTCGSASYEELRDALEIANNRLGIYQNTVNQIDDYFEYRNESKADRKKVYQIIGNMTDDLASSEETLTAKLYLNRKNKEKK